MRRLFTALLLTVFVFISIGVGHVSAEEPPYESPWLETDVNLYKLIKDGYEIVGTSAIVVRGSIFEIIYLKKKNNLYICNTLWFDDDSTGHGCNILIEPKKTQ